VPDPVGVNAEVSVTEPGGKVKVSPLPSDSHGTTGHVTRYLTAGHTEFDVGGSDARRAREFARAEFVDQVDERAPRADRRKLAGIADEDQTFDAPERVKCCREHVLGQHRCLVDYD
jgi:hypothetical protein